MSLLIFSCSDEENEVSTEAFISSELQPFFNSFELEAANRGIEIDIDEMGISGFIENLDGDIAGQCASLSNGSKEVRIDADYWNISSVLNREFVIFHELGHCALGRAHLDDAERNGTCSSIMNSGLSGCRIRYGSGNRNNYLDELFLGL